MMGYIYYSARENCSIVVAWEYSLPGGMRILIVLSASILVLKANADNTKNVPQNRCNHFKTWVQIYLIIKYFKKFFEFFYWIKDKSLNFFLHIKIFFRLV